MSNDVEPLIAKLESLCHDRAFIELDWGIGRTLARYKQFTLVRCQLSRIVQEGASLQKRENEWMLLGPQGLARSWPANLKAAGRLVYRIGNAY